MKRVIDKCRSDNESPLDVVKLRLRGQGSGFKEGHLRRESNEPLHLCVSSMYFDKFSTAIEEVERLLSRVYADYDKFLRRKRLRPARFHIKKVQNNPVKALADCFDSEVHFSGPSC